MGAKKKSGMDRVLILLEHMQDQQRLLAEGQTAMREEIKDQLVQMEARLVARIEVLEAVVREHSVMLKEHSAMLKEHSAELRAIRNELELMTTRSELQALERRVSSLEARLGA